VGGSQSGLYGSWGSCLCEKEPEVPIAFGQRYESAPYRGGLLESDDATVLRPPTDRLVAEPRLRPSRYLEPAN
jgi:hypothetical protein